MGGEWDFDFKEKKLSTFDHTKYQQLLLEIREKFKNVKFEDCKVRWCKQQPPADNIFVEFHCRPNFLSQKPSWKLFWDFNLEKTERDWIQLLDGLHCKMCNYSFRKKSQAIQRKLLKVFPDHFNLHYENYEEHGFDYDDDQLVYHGACSMECANCGLCW